MLKDRLRGLLGGNGAPAPQQQPLGRPSISSSFSGPPVTRQSNGLEQFFNAQRDSYNLSLLDMGGASQANITFITELGHRLYSEDFLSLLDHNFLDDGDFFANQSDEKRLDTFCSQSLGFEEGQFDGVLLWDALQFVAPPLLQMTVDRLHEIVRPGAYMLSFFSADERAPAVPVYSYRIMDHKNLTLVPKGTRQRAQYFNNRTIEKLFGQFSSMKFFLARDNLREVLIRR